MLNKISTLPYKSLRRTIALPFILGIVVPLVLFDICLEVYHRVVFPLYGIPIVRRRDYIKIDRQKLSYLGFFDKLWCMYCGYANGLMAYGVQIAGKTEAYWCGIKHQPTHGFHEPSHHRDFLEYNDEQGYREFLRKKNSS